MFTAFSLALGQLSDPRVLRVLAKSLGVTLALFAVLGFLGWMGLDAVLVWAGMTDRNFEASEGLRGLLVLAILLLGGWVLWRIIALAVLQFFADEVVEAVEVRHYPQAHALAQPLGIKAELANGLKSAGRAIGYNLLALPLAALLLVTGIGAALVFWLVNAVVLGRELMDIVWLRHRHDPAAAHPLPFSERFMLGGLVAAMLAIPFANLLAPVLGAAMATHLVHRKGVSGNAA